MFIRPSLNCGACSFALCLFRSLSVNMQTL